ncbi:MAG TPA: TolC family protein [Vicinamibacterales bacterium]|jgi:outer membrane protein TolC|nr:TolC family protein [Vicinamibacterales bacterium]
MAGDGEAPRLVVFRGVIVVAILAMPGLGEAQPPNPFAGSVPTGQATGTLLDLSLSDAFERALRYNLGAIEGRENTRAAHAARLRSLNALLANVSGRVSDAANQINLQALGFRISIPGVPISPVVGPFNVTDARLYVTQELFNWSDLQGLKSSGESERASVLTYQSDRDLVVFTTGNEYLLVISDAAAVESARAQVRTAQTLYDQDVDKNAQGVIARIDVLRARVELQTQQQRLIAAENQLNIDKLGLARVIGLPNGQDFRLTDAVPYRPLDEVGVNQALAQAFATRPDYQAAQRQVRAAELALDAATAEVYPSGSMAADYGAIGSPNFGAAHPSYSVSVALNIPIFQGSRVRADKLQAESALEQRRAELADLGGRIDDQVRTALYNLRSFSELVAVAQSNMDLSNETVVQAQDRLSAGVANNLEVVQAQESVAAANQSYIASLYAFNLAKISFAQTLGVAERSGVTYLLGRQ